MTTVFISHPFSSSPKRNCSQVARIARRLAVDHHLPLPPQVLFPHFIDEAMEREFALRLCLKLVAVANELRV